MIVNGMPLWMIQLAVDAAEVTEELDIDNVDEMAESASALSSILGSNLVNIVIIVGLLVYLGRNVIGDILAKRRTAIMQELADAEKRKRAAADALANQQQKLAQAQQDAERIKQQANENAEKLRADLLANAEDEIAKMRAAADRDVASAQEQVMEELRKRIARQALDKVERELPQKLTESSQRQLIDQNIQLLGGGN